MFGFAKENLIIKRGHIRGEWVRIIHIYLNKELIFW